MSKLWEGSGLKEAQTFDRGTFLQEGSYTLKIEKVLSKDTVKSGNAFIVEFTVVASNKQEHPIGQRVTWFQKTQNKMVAFGAIKEWVAAVMGYDLKTPASKMKFDAECVPQIEAIVTAAEATGYLNGQIVKCQVDKVMTQPTPQSPQGNPFSRHTWIPNAVRP